jgi:hypothetical protein
MIRAKGFLAEVPDGLESEVRTHRWAVMLQKSEGERPSQADLQHWEEDGSGAEHVLEEIEEAFLVEDE